MPQLFRLCLMGIVLSGIGLVNWTMPASAEEQPSSVDAPTQPQPSPKKTGIAETPGVGQERSSEQRNFEIATFADLERYAELKSTQEHQPSTPLPESISKLSYDQYRLIHFRHEHAIWQEHLPQGRQSPFWFEAFHRGFVHRDQVKLHTIEKGRVQSLPFDTSRFEYRGELGGVTIPADTEYAGARIAGWFPGQDDAQEMLIFLGASYFRMRTAESVYGTSCRGLAINVGTNQPEEFPVFRELWLKKPDFKSRTITILALLDSPSLSGAYEFTFEPGVKLSEMNVRATLFFRNEPEKVALAPLTSMWMWGDGLIGPALDKRPHVHDSDGLLIHAGPPEQETWTWRALSRQSYPSISRLPVQELQGFGLIQRNTRYIDYRDDQALYHQRPSIWIEPTSTWPRGRVELLEIDGAHEGVDNIVASWVLDQVPPVGQPFRYSYRVECSTDKKHKSTQQTLAQVKQTRISRDPSGEKPLIVEIDFMGGELAEITDPEELSTQLVTVRAELLSQQLVNQGNGTWTLRLELQPESDLPCELQAVLVNKQRCLSETWNYLCAVREPAYKIPQVYTRLEE